MSNKYTSRHQSVISRNADENIDEDHWLKQFQKKLEKGAVQPKNNKSLFEQISSIMNGNSRYPSVEAAVKDMQERSGLTAYLDNLNKISTPGTANKKTASDENESFDKKVNLTPIVIEKFPNIKNTLQNYINESKGNLPVPAIIDHIRGIHSRDVSDPKYWEDNKLIKLVSEMNLKAKQNNPEAFENYTNLGTHDHAKDEIDPSNSDAFHSLMPVKN